MIKMLKNDYMICLKELAKPTQLLMILPKKTILLEMSNKAKDNLDSMTSNKMEPEIKLWLPHIKLLKQHTTQKNQQLLNKKKLLDIAREIGKEMELLSIAAQKGNIEDLIAISKKLAGMIDGVQKNAIDIASKCTDPILKEQLLAVCKVPKNFSVQLKIIAAVKAASLAKHDKSAEYQLVVCAQGLANSVIQTVKAAEAASLKVPKTGGSFVDSSSSDSSLSTSSTTDSSPKQSSFFKPKNSPKTTTAKPSGKPLPSTPKTGGGKGISGSFFK